MTTRGFYLGAVVVMAPMLLLHASVRPDAQPQSNRHSLDLMAHVSEESSADERGWLGPPPAADAASDRSPFAAKLVRFDRAVYDLGDNVIYELELTNVSTEDVWMPWLGTSKFITPRTEGASSMQLCLQFEDPHLGLQVFGFRRTYGAESVPGSLRLVAPGDVVEIRANAPLRLMQAWPRIDANWVKVVSLRAVATLSTQGQPARRMPSANALSIELRGR
jgi:hypothetical protein